MTSFAACVNSVLFHMVMLWRLGRVSADYLILYKCTTPKYNRSLKLIKRNHTTNFYYAFKFYDWNRFLCETIL